MCDCEKATYLENPEFVLNLSIWEHGNNIFIKIQISKCGKGGCKDEPLATKEEEQVFFFVVVAILIPFLTVFQATRCSFSGKLASDPDSTVYISGCAEEESMDISVMSKKVNATCHRLLPPSSDPHNAHAIASPFFSPLLLLFYSSLALSSSSLNCQILHLLMTCFQSKLQFNTYRVGKSGKI